MCHTLEKRVERKGTAFPLYIEGHYSCRRDVAGLRRCVYANQGTMDSGATAPCLACEQLAKMLLACDAIDVNQASRQSTADMACDKDLPAIVEMLPARAEMGADKATAQMLVRALPTPIHDERRIYGPLFAVCSVTRALGVDPPPPSTASQHTAQSTDTVELPLARYGRLAVDATFIIIKTLLALYFCTPK